MLNAAFAMAILDLISVHILLYLLLGYPKS